MSSSGPDPADWRTTSMMGLKLEGSGLKETPALGYAFELYKHPQLRGYMDKEISSRIPSMKDIQDVYEAMAETSFREYLINVQEKMVRRWASPLQPRSHWRKMIMRKCGSLRTDWTGRRSPPTASESSTSRRSDRETGVDEMKWEN